MSVADLSPVQLYSIALVAVLIGGVLPLFIWQYVREAWGSMGWPDRAKLFAAALFLYGLPAYVAFTAL
jgi:hypothetical protein